MSTHGAETSLDLGKFELPKVALDGKLDSAKNVDGTVAMEHDDIMDAMNTMNA